MGYHLGLDLGATRTHCLVVTDDLQRVEAFTRETVQGPTGAETAAGLLACIDRALESTGIDRMDTIGVASIGPLDAEAGVVCSPTNVDVDRIPVREAIERRAPASTLRVMNDATAAVAGAAQRIEDPVDNLVYLTLSTGVGAGVMVDGEVLDGWRGNAAEVGHYTLAPDGGLRCGCGGYGHWEAYASGANVPRYAAYLAEEPATSDRSDAGYGGGTDLPLEALDAETVFDRYGEDPLATETLDRVARWNALGVANVVQSYAPERVVVGGSVAVNNETLVVSPIRDRLPELTAIDVPEITVCDDDFLGALGAIVRSRRSR